MIVEVCSTRQELSPKQITAATWIGPIYLTNGVTYSYSVHLK
jgi:hypothetical protein